MQTEHRNDELIDLGTVIAETRGGQEGIDDQDVGLAFGFGLPNLLDD